MKAAQIQAYARSAGTAAIAAGRGNAGVGEAGKALTPKPAHLTPRQSEVLGLLREGLSNKVIGHRLNISGATVKIHIASIFRALGVSSRLQAVLEAARLDACGKLRLLASAGDAFGMEAAAMTSSAGCAFDAGKGASRAL